MVAGTPMNAHDYLMNLGQSGNEKSLFQQMDELASQDVEHEFGEKLDMHYRCCKIGTKLHEYMTKHPEDVVGDDRFSRFLNSFNDKVAPMIVAGLFKINIWALMRIYHYSIPLDNTDHETTIDIGMIMNCPWHDWTDEEVYGGLLAWEQMFNDKDDEDNFDIRQQMVTRTEITDEIIKQLRACGVPIDSMIDEAQENGRAWSTVPV